MRFGSPVSAGQASCMRRFRTRYALNPAVSGDQSGCAARSAMMKDWETRFFRRPPAGLTPQKVAVRFVLEGKDCERMGEDEKASWGKGMKAGYPSRRARLSGVMPFVGQQAFCLYPWRWGGRAESGLACCRKERHSAWQVRKTGRLHSSDTARWPVQGMEGLSPDILEMRHAVL